MYVTFFLFPLFRKSYIYIPTYFPGFKNALMPFIYISCSLNSTHVRYLVESVISRYIYPYFFYTIHFDSAKFNGHFLIVPQ